MKRESFGSGGRIKPGCNVGRWENGWLKNGWLAGKEVSQVDAAQVRKGDASGNVVGRGVD